MEIDDIDQEDLEAASDCYDRLVFRQKIISHVEFIQHEANKLNYNNEYIIEVINDLLN